MRWGIMTSGLDLKRAVARTIVNSTEYREGKVKNRKIRRHLDLSHRQLRKVIRSAAAAV